MPQLLLKLTDELTERLGRLAAAQKKTLQQVILDQLALLPEPPEEDLKERYEQFIKESGLFREFTEEEKQRYQAVSEERLQELAEKLGAAGPLSEVIIDERGRR
jgi:hypothetical protein